MATTSDRVQSGRTRRVDPISVRIYSLCVLGCFFALISTSLLQLQPAGPESLSALAAWAVIAAAADTLRVRLWDDFSFAMSLPVTLAAGMVLPPTDAAIVAFVGAFDMKDFSGEIPLERVLLNRAMAGLSIYAGSSAFHALGFTLTDWPRVLLSSVLAYAIDFTVNMALVTFPVSRLQGVSVHAVLARVLEPTPSQTVLIYGCVGLLSPVVALVATTVGVLGVAVLLLPLGLARNAYLQLLRLHEVAQRMHDKNKALRSAAQQAAEGRRDERMVLAGELKDGVVPSLTRVHLMGQVLRQDLLHGRLLQLDDDLPALLAATNAAQAAVQGVMRGLKDSPVGIGGLPSALRVLADQLEASSPGVRIRLHLSEVHGSDAAMLALFEVAREALRNAVRHSHAASIDVRLLTDGERIRLVVQDDGMGFEPRAAYGAAGLGLSRIREGVESLGGDVAIVSNVGEGTIVVAAVPPGA